MPSAAFFFGSGISFASGAPTVDQITFDLLERKWFAHTDGRFFPRPLDYIGETGEATRAQKFLERIKQKIDPRISSREKRLANYEDLFSADLLSRLRTANMRNPHLSEAQAVAQMMLDDDKVEGYLARNLIAVDQMSAFALSPKVQEAIAEIQNCLDPG